MYFYKKIKKLAHNSMYVNFYFALLRCMRTKGSYIFTLPYKKRKCQAFV